MTTRVPIIVASLSAVVNALLIFAPLWILGAAIGWPASLDLPPSAALPLIGEKLGQVRLGYGIYLLYSILWAPMGAAIAWLAIRRDGVFGPLASLAVGLACASALARAIGIIRWLTATAVLSDAYDASSDEAGRRSIEMVQLAINAWGGAIGEFLGVAVFASAWLLVVAVLILANRSLPRWLGLSGLIVGLVVFLPALELFGFELISVTLSTTVLHIWLLAIGGVALWQGLIQGR